MHEHKWRALADALVSYLEALRSNDLHVLKLYADGG